MFYKLRYERQMRKILKHIIRNKRLPELSTPQARQVLADCVEQGFISGIVGGHVANNDFCADIRQNLFVTYAGRRFLSHDGIKSTVAVVISLLALLVSLLSNLDSILKLIA